MASLDLVPDIFTAWLRMYDVDGNGVIDLQEMIKIVASIYKMMGEKQVTPKMTILPAFVFSTGCCFGGRRPRGKSICHI